MKSKRFDTIIMDDLVGEATSFDGLSKKLKEWADKKREHDDSIDALTYSTPWIRSSWFDPDYEDAKDLIREVVSEQDQEP